VVEKISQKDLDKLAIGGSRVTPVTPRPAPAAAPQPQRQDNSMPFASMAASMTEINQRLANVVTQNSVVIDGLQRKLSEQKPVAAVPRGAWRAIVKRDKSKLIDYVDIVPMELKNS